MSEHDGQRLLKRILAGLDESAGPLTHVELTPARPEHHAEWPSFATREVVDALRDSGMPAPWTHQAQAAELAWSGRHVVVSTGTASGKSACYLLPVLTALTSGKRDTALYLAPTKALGADQVRSVGELGLSAVRAATVDGDTPLGERDWAAAHANWLFTNPDMLHFSLLPRHERWARFFRNLRFVVIDECHAYRGLFGSHVALLIRRLRRIAARYGADPVFLLASATAAEPGHSASALTGLEVTEVTEDGSPRGARTVALWEPPLESETGEHGAPVRRQAGAEAARVLADLVIEGARTLAFVRSRHGAELTALGAKRILGEIDNRLAGKIAAYRGGYLAEDRRGLESALDSGSLLGVATTNALELGIDITGLDAVLVAGYPGTLASFWQQAGRAGRAGEDEPLVVFIARDDPLDTYLVHHPEAIFDRPVESTVLDPANPYVLGPHLACATAELPLTRAGLAEFGGAETAEPLLTELTEQKLVRARPHGWFWSSRDRPHGTVDLRGSGGGQIAVVEGDTGRLLGTVDAGSAPSSVHEGAVHLHQGESFVVDSLDLDEGIALVHAERPDWITTPREVVDIRVLETLTRQEHGDGVTSCLGSVEVTSQVIGYLRKLPSGQVLDQVPLDLPEQVLRTRAVWYTVGEDLLRNNAPGGAGLDPARIPGALHAAEHAAIGLLPLFATCDRWDIGGVSTALHADTGEATVFVHDGHPGGAGFADRGFAALVPWLATTRKAISACECPAGCPSCVQSPKCGNGNEPLDKQGAMAVLSAVLPVLRSGVT
ncbi:DEAD/DEAH box helicase [Sciscionella sediminilitoris]|uniref:DEAD/DEAH box helicase n=1 Tax=Sciscionella sediminilitoris TaxID=1445613 RepID=UPI0004DF98BA|nr:DEAD/DEAH box helicase [Sciscionella sp. SE31]